MLIDKALEKIKRQASQEGRRPAALNAPTGISGHEGDAVEARAAPVEIKTNALVSLGWVRAEQPTTPVFNEFLRIKNVVARNAAATEPEASYWHSNLVLVTSSIPGEGKSFTALKLALALSLDEEGRVLLVDGDIVRGSLTEAFGLGGAPGLTDYLVSREMSLDDVVHPTDVPRLNFVPRGTAHGSTADLLGGRRMAELAERLGDRSLAQVTIFDSTPLLGATEAQTLIEHVGQVLFVVEAAKTPRAAADTALETLTDSDKIVNLILNKARPDRFGGDAYQAYLGEYGH